jgi:isopenicillin N synthase-like dioxygenase
VLPVPVVDLAARGDDRRAAARTLDQACRHVGVFELVGHGFPMELVEATFAVTREFFALPDDVKADVAQPAPDQVRGWSALGSEGITYSLDEESPADLKEKFDVGPVDDVDPGLVASAGPHLAPNLWPTALPQLRPLWERTYRHLDRIGADLLALCAVGLGLPGEWFEPRTDRSISMLRALWYPDQDEPPLAGQTRAGVHSDYGAFTIMTAEDRPGGYEVLDRGGEWTPVATAPGRFLVAVGDLLAEWTDDAWPSTLHRVVNPPRAVASDSARLALAFYQHPNHDLRVEPLPPFRTGTAPTPGEPLSAGDHLRQKYLRQTTFGRA